MTSQIGAPGAPRAAVRCSLVLLLCLGRVLPSGVQAAETGQAIMAVQLRRHPRDLSWWRPRLSAFPPRARPAPPWRDSEDKESCPPGQEVTKVDEMLVLYSEGELQACVDGALVAEQLDQVDAIPFTYQQLAVFKHKLDQTYPQGYPVPVVQRLGHLFLLVSPEDIGKWDKMSTETLKALIQVSRGQKADTQLAALIARYGAGGFQAQEDTVATVATLSPAHLCQFSPGQLELLQPSLLWEVKPGDLAGCPWPQMEVLYSKAHITFQNMTGPGYLDRIRPYLGGATTENLRALSQQNVSMDMATFKQLQTEAVLETGKTWAVDRSLQGRREARRRAQETQKATLRYLRQPLTVAEVQRLLGPHVVDLKSEEWNSPVGEWIARQWQEDLDTLGLGLQGGLPNGYLVIDLGAPGGHG